MTTCFWVEPVVLFRYGLHADVGIYFKDYIYHTLVTLLTTAAVWQICVQLPGAGLPLFLTKMAVCAVLGNLGYLLASPGFCDERLHMFLAQELEHLDSHPDEDEFLDVFTMPYSELLSKVMAGELHDAKSVAITLKTKVLLGL